MERVGDAVDEVLEEAALVQRLTEEKKKRAIACLKKIQEFLKESNCDIIPTFQIVGNEMKTGYQILAK